MTLAQPIDKGKAPESSNAPAPAEASQATALLTPVGSAVVTSMQGQNKAIVDSLATILPAKPEELAAALGAWNATILKVRAMQCNDSIVSN